MPSDSRREESTSRLTTRRFASNHERNRWNHKRLPRCLHCLERSVENTNGYSPCNLRAQRSMLSIAHFPPPKPGSLVTTFTAIRAELLVNGNSPPRPVLPSTHPFFRSVPLTHQNGCRPHFSLLSTQLNGLDMSYPIFNPTASSQPPYDGVIACHEYPGKYAFHNAADHVPAGLSSFALAFPPCSPSTHSRQPHIECSVCLWALP